ncbi:hypothetical protein EHQ64_10985 [Leptospira sarikeiensis]|uniref:Uncharacterized protein n=2 Tax=Leptospira sarikeiensis TaxID=2484943 RepID=A0A4R9K820_9LEPT|nr:hypothetical protein EHQ64_10985 [Leptospira sarikeiensis]
MFFPLRSKYLPFIFILMSFYCSSFPRKDKSLISREHQYSLFYTNEDGNVYHASLSLKTKYKDALSDLEKFESEFIEPQKQKYLDRIKEVSLYTSELKKDSSSIVRRLGGVLAIAAITPVPFAFETTLTVGLIYVSYKKITETSEEKLRKKHVEFLINECSNSEDSLEDFKEDHLDVFVSNWKEEFMKESNHFVNADDWEDVRLLDTLMEKYQIDKERIKINADWEWKASAQHCNRETKEEKDSRIHKEEKKWKKNGSKIENRVGLSEKRRLEFGKVRIDLLDGIGT